MDRRSLFQAYNHAKPYCEPRRLNRGLGIAQRKEYRSDYITTETTCSCPDFYYRRIRCKHQIALILGKYA